MNAVFVLGMVLACMSVVLCSDTCNRYDVNGCSTPFSMPFFYKRRFTHACNRHDVCYRCAHHFGIRRELCDLDFFDKMKQSCRSLRKRRSAGDMGRHIEKRSLDRDLCELFANGYYTVVKRFGESRFQIPSKPFCNQIWWVMQCLPQSAL